MTTPVFEIPTLDAAAAGKVEQVNRALRHVEAVYLGRIESRTLTTPPGSPADGVKYIPATGATGDWAGQDGKLAYYRNGTWVFQTVKDGMTAWFEGDKAMMSFADSEWFPLQDQDWSAEHWTGKYRGGSKVYAKTLSGITLPNSTTTNTAHGIAGVDFTAGKEPQLRGSATFVGGAFPLPNVDTMFSVSNIAIDATNVSITTNYAASALTGMVRVEYCKA